MQDRWPGQLDSPPDKYGKRSSYFQIYILNHCSPIVSQIRKPSCYDKNGLQNKTKIQALTQTNLSA